MHTIGAPILIELKSFEPKKMIFLYSLDLRAFLIFHKNRMTDFTFTSISSANGFVTDVDGLNLNCRRHHHLHLTISPIFSSLFLVLIRTEKRLPTYWLAHLLAFQIVRLDYLWSSESNTLTLRMLESGMAGRPTVCRRQKVMLLTIAAFQSLTRSNNVYVPIRFTIIGATKDVLTIEAHPYIEEFFHVASRWAPEGIMNWNHELIQWFVTLCIYSLWNRLECESIPEVFLKNSCIQKRRKRWM